MSSELMETSLIANRVETVRGLGQPYNQPTQVSEQQMNAALVGNMFETRKELAEPGHVVVRLKKRKELIRHSSHSTPDKLRGYPNRMSP